MKNFKKLMMLSGVLFVSQTAFCSGMNEPDLTVTEPVVEEVASVEVATPTEEITFVEAEVTTPEATSNPVMDCINDISAYKQALEAAEFVDADTKNLISSFAERFAECNQILADFDDAIASLTSEATIEEQSVATELPVVESVTVELAVPTVDTELTAQESSAIDLQDRQD